MSTVRTLITEALQITGAIAPGDSPAVDELNVGLQAFNRFVEEIHEARGPLTDVDVTADYVASENQRCRVQAGDDVTVTLPNSIQLSDTPDPYDYGFAAPQIQPPQGSTGIADGVRFRQPRDGTRIEIVGTAEALYFYRADLNQWLAAYGLTLDTESPFNRRLNSAVAALVGEKLIDLLPAAQMSPSLAARIARGRAAMMLQTGRAHSPVKAEYF